MKNAILYYYQLNAENIHQFEKQYRFQIEKEHYILMAIDMEVEVVNELYQLSNLLLEHRYTCHQIIPNQQGLYVTIINQQAYVLLKLYLHASQPVILNDCTYYTSNALKTSERNVLKRNNWYELWTNKIDYMEYQMNQFGKKFPLIRESFGYYIGMAENSVQFYRQIPVEKEYLYIAHRRITKNQTVTDFYNPLSFILDYKVRDASEYFKMRFFNGYSNLDDVKSYVEDQNLTDVEMQLFFCRMLFPSYYFDLYEEVIANELPEKKLLDIIDKVELYEQFLREIHEFLATKISIPNIEWI